MLNWSTARLLCCGYHDSVEFFEESVDETMVCFSLKIKLIALCIKIYSVSHCLSYGPLLPFLMNDV